MQCSNGKCEIKHELDDEDFSVPFTQNNASGTSSFYGSMGTSGTGNDDLDGQNKWFVDHFDDEFREIGDMERLVGERFSRPTSFGSFPLDREGSSGVFCDEACCSEAETALVISGNHHGLMSTGGFGYTTYEESSVPDFSSLTPLVNKSIGSFASTSLVAWNIMNLLLSTSLLAFPFAISRGGFIVLPFIVLIALMTNYTSRILVEMMYDKPQRNRPRTRIRIDYVDLGQDVFDSFKGAVFVQLLQVLEMFAICVLNLCVLGNLGHEIMRSLSVRICTALAAVIAFPTFFVRKLVIIGWLQTIGVISLAIGFVLIQGFCVSHFSSWKVSNVPSYNLRHLPIAIGIIIYSFGIQGILPGLEERMKEPRRYGFVINLTFFIAVCAQCFFSVTNAMYYGNKTNQLITIDLSDHFALGISTACFLAISILSHFSLPSMVVMEKLDDALHRIFPYCGNADPNYRTCKNKLMTVLIRMFVMGLSLVIAVVVPYFAYLMAFIGSSITVLLTFIIPCCFHLKLLGNSLTFFYKFIDIFIIAFGVICLLLGSYLSFEAIYKSDAS